MTLFSAAKMRHQNPSGKAAKAPTQLTELRDTFIKWESNWKKAFTVAAKETRAAFKKVSRRIPRKIRQSASIVFRRCSHLP